jgi:putative membrane protein
MTESAPPASTLPPASAPPALGDGTGTPPVSAAPPASAATPPRARRTSRIGATYTAMIAGAVALIVVLIFIVENAHSVTISFVGQHLRVSLAVALLLAAIAGALIMAAVGTARIAQLRLALRRGRRPARAR